MGDGPGLKYKGTTAGGTTRAGPGVTASGWRPKGTKGSGANSEAQPTRCITAFTSIPTSTTSFGWLRRMAARELRLELLLQGRCEGCANPGRLRHAVFFLPSPSGRNFISYTH